VGGDVEEYELQYRLEFDVKGSNDQQLLPRQSVDAIRAYTYDTEQVLAKEREQERLYREMRQDLVNALLYRLQSIQLEAQ
jgi:LPS-assembly lipoprotein